MGITYTKQPVKAVISDVTASRDIVGTIYQNTSGRPKICFVSLACLKNAAADDCYARGFVKISSPPDVEVETCGLVGLAGSGTQSLHAIMIFAVPNEYYYRVAKGESGTSTVTLEHWFEVEL